MLPRAAVKRARPAREVLRDEREGRGPRLGVTSLQREGKGLRPRHFRLTGSISSSADTRHDFLQPEGLWTQAEEPLLSSSRAQVTAPRHGLRAGLPCPRALRGCGLSRVPPGLHLRGRPAGPGGQVLRRFLSSCCCSRSSFLFRYEVTLSQVAL